MPSASKNVIYDTALRAFMDPMTMEYFELNN
jgi:hypothetical protein